MPVKKYKDPFKESLKAPNPKGATKEPPSSGKEFTYKNRSEQPITGISSKTLPTQNGALSVPPTETSSVPTKKYNKDTLKIGWSTLSGRALDWLQEGDRLEQMMAETKLRDLGVFLGIATEKVLLLEGQPTQIISQPQHQAIDRLGVALKDALEKRGLVTMTERTVKIEPPTSKPSS